MDGLADFISENSQKREPKVNKLEQSRVKALKSLALLLLREVEQIERTEVSSGECLRNQEVSLMDDVQRYEAELIRSALLQSKGHQLRAARILGVKNNTLCAKIKRYGIEYNNIMGKVFDAQTLET